MRSADVSREIYPAVNLNLAVFPSLTARSFVNRLHQWIRWKLTGITDDLRPANLPIGRRERRRVERCWWDASGVRRIGIRRNIGGRAQLLQKGFVQTLEKWFVLLLLSTRSFRFFFPDLSLLLSDLCFFFLIGSR